MNWADIDKWISNLQGKARITTMKSHGMLQGRVKRKGIIKALDRKHVPREADESRRGLRHRGTQESVTLFNQKCLC